MLTLNVGLSKKIGEPNYGSKGASVTVEQEVSSDMVNDPAKLKEAIRKLFALVRSSLEEELSGTNGHTNGHNGSGPVTNGNGSGPTNGHGGNGSSGPSPTNGNGHREPKANGNGPDETSERKASKRQANCIATLARVKKVNLYGLLREHFGVTRVEDLPSHAASMLIDQLKLEEAHDN